MEFAFHFDESERLPLVTGLFLAAGPQSPGRENIR